MSTSSIKRIAFRVRTGIRNFAYPASLQSLWVILSITVALQFTKQNFPVDLHGQSICYRLMACSIIALFIWVCFCMILRYTLKLLLMYNGWMYESRVKGSKTSLATRLWAMSIKMLIMGNKPGLYSFQLSLPRLPVPNVNETITRYLGTVRPLLNDEQFKRMQNLAKEFEQTIASNLQLYLILKSWWSSNYVTDWWEKYIYLRGRSPLMVNSNCYCLDVISNIETNIQSARAAVIVHLMLKFRHHLEREELQPIMVQNLVPLCSWQYERMFNTVRVPGIETDRIVHYQNIDHIVVMHNGCYYKVIIHKGRLLEPAEIQAQLEEILNSKSESLLGEERLAALTAWDRPKWAKMRKMHFNDGVNAESLHVIETAAFVLCLDNEAYDTDGEEALSSFGKSMIHGNGNNRWFDKNFLFIVGTNGITGFNSEHSWADATLMGHLYEYALKIEAIEQFYDENGNCKGSIELKLRPQRLFWYLNDETCLAKIDEAHEDAQRLMEDLQLRIFRYDNYGKGFMKKCGISPDAYLQMTLQLAYFRDAGQFTLSYETSMTRLFLQGRTETVRPVTMESVAWVKAMEDDTSTNEHRVALLRMAGERHQRSYRDAMCGKGVDRHLFCLHIVSKYLEMESPFLKEALGQPWRLSTSQTSQDQTQMPGMRFHRNSAGCGFGPVEHDGYGVSYMITGEDQLNFHVSSRTSCPTTDALRFSKQIKRALADVYNLFS